MRQRTSWLAALAAILTAVAAAEPGPVLVFGAAYGRYEARAVVNEVLVPAQLVHDHGGDYVPPAAWTPYSTVIVCDLATPLAEPDALAAARQFVQNGGSLVLLGTAMGGFRTAAAAETAWLGARGYQNSRGHVNFEHEDHPGAPPADAQELFFNLFATGAFTAEPAGAAVLIAVGDRAAAYVHAHGQGRVVYVGRELFRVRNAENEQKKPLGGDQLAAWLVQLVATDAALTWPEHIRRGLAGGGLDRPVVWWREPGEAGRGAAYFRDPFPRPDELAPAVALDLAQDEYESFALHVSTPVAVESYEVSGSLAGRALRVRRQGLARPDLTVGTWWLLDPAAPAHALEANTTTTFWFTLDTFDLAPGVFAGELRCGAQRVPLSVTVHPVRLPGREYFGVQATHMWGSLGFDTRKLDPANPPDPTVFHRHLDNLAAHHVTYMDDGYWTLGTLRLARLREDGTPLPEAIRQGRVSLDALPALDLSVLNPWVDAAIERGIPWFHAMMRNQPDDWLGEARRIAGAQLAADSPEHWRVKTWLIGEVADYLRSRGIRRIVSAMGDEIAPAEIADFVRRAEPVQEHGLMPLLTITGMVGKRPELIAELRPAVDVWVWNAQVMPDCLALVRARPETLKPGDLMHTYTSEWHGMSYLGNRQRGAYFASLGLDGWFIHGYLRWYPNGGGVFGGPDGPIDTEGWEGARDGIEDARLLARLRHLSGALADHPQAGAAARLWQQRIEDSFGSSPEVPVTLRQHDLDHNPETYGGPWSTRWWSPHSDLARLRQLHRRLLEGLAALEPFAPAPGLAYGGLPLVAGEALAARFEGSPEAVASLRTALAGTLPEGAARSVLAVGDERTSPLIAEALAAGRLRVTPRYPAEGEFVIVTLPELQPLPATILYARDALARQRAATQFLHLVDRIP